MNTNCSLSKDVNHFGKTLIFKPGLRNVPEFQKSTLEAISELNQCRGSGKWLHKGLDGELEITSLNPFKRNGISNSYQLD